MADTENLQRIVEKLQGISNGSLKEIVSSGQSQEIAAQVTDTLSGGELANVLEGEVEFWVPDAQVTVGHWEGIGTPATSVTDIQKVAPAGPITQYNSNETAIQRGTIKQVYNTTVDEQAGTFSLSSTPKTGSFAANAAYFLGEVNQAVCAASVGIALGKTIDSALYNLNPDFWDANGMSSINPETWSSITYGDDSIGANLFNLVFGIDPATNKGQAYIDETAFAYMAQFLASAGVFSGMTYYQAILQSGKRYAYDQFYYIETTVQTVTFKAHGSTITDKVIMVTENTGGNIWIIRGTNSNVIPAVGTKIVMYQIGSYSYLTWRRTVTSGSISGFIGNSLDNMSNIMNGDVDSWNSDFGTPFNAVSCPVYGFKGVVNVAASIPNSLSGIGWAMANAIHCAFNGEHETIKSGGVDGIDTQPNAQTPTNTNAWTTPQNTLDSLKQQYPDIWDGALTYDNLQPDGTLKPQTYVPIPMPTFNPDMSPWSDTKPTYDPATSPTPNPQTDPTVDLDDFPDPYPNPLTRTLTETPTPNPDPVVPQNPVDTGNGSSPTPIVPTGSASALWSVYHPTQQQVNDFGGWLWSSNFIDQLLRMFQNPMDAVVSLRKVFVMPVDAGVSTIHAGYLDSEVPSSYITQQYVFKDCGTINCYEQFGNVFDYINTEISMYLPFIGIVPLNTSEVMRSQLHVVYGVDMFTGACLASIEVIRDGNTVTMYQYAGNASVEYPLSGQRASSFLGGLMSLGGAVASVATGGGSVVAAGAAISGMSQMSTVNVSHSGSFSGNAGAMGIKKPYLIIERPQTKVASNDEYFTGYSNNYSGKVSDFSGMVKARKVHVLGINATDGELAQIETLLKDGIII